ncbi:MAG: tail fiber domain-containing protein [Flavobacteriales bacterium]
MKQAVHHRITAGTRSILNSAAACASLFLSHASLAQTGVAIGTSTPVAHASAALDVQSTTQGVLVPRMTTAQRNAIASPATGLMVFDTSLNQFWYYSSSAWVAIGATSAWSLTGNAGINPALHFIGTTDAQPIILKQNGNRAGYIASNNTALGNGSMNVNTGSGNTAIGYQALGANTTGSGNTVVGNNAMSNSAVATTNNTVIGSLASSQIAGVQNTVIGAGALSHGAARNVALGHYAGNGFAHNDCVFLGEYASANAALTNAIAIGQNRAVTANNQVRIGNSSITSIGGQVGWSTLSDARTKHDVSADVHGLDFILKLRPVTYRYDVERTVELTKEGWRMDTLSRILAPGTVDAHVQAGRDAQSRVRYTGFIAQEVEQAAKTVGYDFSGVDAPKNADDLYALRYAEFTVPLVKAVQEQQALIEELMRRIEILEKR